jgi:hypothetical protein
MDITDPLAQVKVAAATYKRSKAVHEKNQATLAAAVVAALRAGVRPADVARASEWDREYNRRLKNAADAADAERPADS